MVELTDQDIAAIWRNGITNTVSIIDAVRRKHPRIRRSAPYAAFQRDLNLALQDWFNTTRAANPKTYAEAEAVFAQHMETTHDH